MAPVRKPELLVPAGNPDALQTAVKCGADAVYIGGESFSLRAKARNFTLEEMREAKDFCHAQGVKLYVTVNAFVHEKDLAAAEDFLKEMAALSPDALIIADAGVFRMAKRLCPAIPVHLSTQANNLNYETFLFWYDLGVRRIVAARELTLSQIASVRTHIPDDMEIECFVHGAVCMAYSGRCMMSRYLTGRDANEGSCTQSCRWNYTVMEEKRPGQYLPVTEDESGTEIFAANDLCMIAHLPKLMQSGVTSFKIEGRTKTATYVEKVTKAYRSAIDDYFVSEEQYRARLPEYEAALSAGASRAFDTGFYLEET